jgi:hypothetical protein
MNEWGVVANTDTRLLRSSASATAARTVRISSSVSHTDLSDA